MGTLLQDGIDAAKSGRMEEALQLLRRSAEENPQNADVWVWLSAIIDDEEKQTEFLKKALEIDPENKPAQRGMAFLKRKKFIAPKPGETLSDHTRPIGVFKAGVEKPAIQQPAGPLAPITEPQVEESSPEVPSDYDPDTENTIPPDQTDQIELGGQIEVSESIEELSSDAMAIPVETSEIQESTDLIGDVAEREITQDTEQREEFSESTEAVASEPVQGLLEEQLGDQVTQVSPVIAAATDVAEELNEEEIEPELDQETQVSSEEPTEIAEAPISKELPKEHPLITEVKRLKWQLLLWGLILAAFIVIGILVGSTLKNLISPQKQALSMNLEPIAKQNGVFLLEGQEFRRLNILKEYPKADAGLVITDLESPQIILKDQMVTDSSKLKLMDASQVLVASKVNMLETNIPVLEAESALNPGRYCVSYVLGSDESQAVFWCFVKN